MIKKYSTENNAPKASKCKSNHAFCYIDINEFSDVIRLRCSECHVIIATQSGI
jgi:hypothetical protein